MKKLINKIFNNTFHRRLESEKTVIIFIGKVYINNRLKYKFKSAIQVQKQLIQSLTLLLKKDDNQIKKITHSKTLKQ